MKDRGEMAIGVFCGSRVAEGALADSVYRFGAAAANAGIGIVFGGGARGLMGSLARGAKANGGRLVGVMSEDTLEHEPVYEENDELIVLPNNQQRRLEIIERSTVIVGFPGGIGTLAEILEALFYKKCTGSSLQVFLYNVDNYYAGLFSLLERAVATGLAKENDMHLLKAVQKEDELISQIMGVIAQLRSR